MKQLTPIENILQLVGGLMLLAGAALPLFMSDETLAFWIYAVGCVLFVAIQILQKYEGASFVVRRLRRQQLIGAACLVAAGALLGMHCFEVGNVGPGAWKLALTIGAIFEVYTAFRIPAEIEKEQQSKD